MLGVSVLGIVSSFVAIGGPVAMDQRGCTIPSALLTWNRIAARIVVHVLEENSRVRIVIARARERDAFIKRLRSVGLDGNLHAVAQID